MFTRVGVGRLALWLLISIPVIGQNAALKPTQSDAGVTEWHALGTGPCSWSERPVHKSDQNLDVTKTIELLKQSKFGCHAMAITTGPPESWAEFQQLVAAADATVIHEWAVLIPPTEGYSALYKHDFVSLRYPHLRGANIDYLDQGENARLFSREYICRIYKAKQAINPKLLFLPTIYSLDREFADRMSGCVDGVWLWWSKIDTVTGVDLFLQRAKESAAGRFPIYGGVYAHWTSWHKNGPPAAPVFRQTLQETCQLADGATIWKFSLQSPNPLLPIAKTFSANGSSPLAGHCGNAPATMTRKLQ